MNVISYINGDARITDFPTCSARPLSLLVQSCNDQLAGPDGYLSPGNSVLALELAWQTVGTADVPDSVVHAWVAELLTSPTWGVLRYAKITAHKAIRDIAELHRVAASGETPPTADWDAAGRTARALAPTLTAAATRAVRAAYESTTFVDNDLLMSLDQVVVHAQNAHALASGDSSTASRITELTGHAIRSWRRLAGLDNPGDKAVPVKGGKVVLKTVFVPTHRRAGTKVIAKQWQPPEPPGGQADEFCPADHPQ